MAWGTIRNDPLYDKTSPGYTGQRDHPSNVGSPTHFRADRGWSPWSGSGFDMGRFNRPATVPSDRQPGFAFANRNVAPNEFAFDRAGSSRGDISPFVSNQANIERANRRGIASLDEDEKMGLLGHAKKALSGFNLGDLPMPKTMKVVGDTISDAMRGSRLMNAFQDKAASEGRSKAAGYKDWKAAKASMMTQKDTDFYRKYMDLAENTQDRDRKQYYLDQAETAWRNKQTSDRLSAAMGFEGYRPEHYTDPAAPGYQRMQEISGGKWGGIGDTPGIADYSDPDEIFEDIAPDRDLRANQNFVDVMDAMEGMSGFDIAPKADEIFDTDDITDDIIFGGGGNERFEEQLAAEQPLPWEAQRQKAIFRNRPQGVRGMLGYGMEFDRMAYPYGEDFQDEVDEFWDISPRTRSRLDLYPNIR